MPTAEDMTVKLPRAKGLPLNTVLRLALDARNVTYLVRRDHLELVPHEYAARITKNANPGDAPAPGQLREPARLGDLQGETAERGRGRPRGFSTT